MMNFEAHRPLFASLALLFAAGCVSDVNDQFLLDDGVADDSGKQSPPIQTDSLIIGDVDWVEITELDDAQQERVNSRSVAYVSIPARGTRCTGFLVAPDVLMTNEHCIRRAADAEGVIAYFRREAGVDQDDWGQVSCETFIGNDSNLDFALLRCEGTPGDTYGTVNLSTETVSQNDDMYIVHQNCDYYTDRSCPPFKKYSPGNVVRVSAGQVRHNADTLGGSSGSPVFSADSHNVIAIHNTGFGNDGNGRGSYNGSVPMARIVPTIQDRFPGVLDGDAPPPPPPGDDNDGFEPNNAANVATDASEGLTAGNLIIASNDRDVFRVTLDTEGSISAAIAFSHGDGDLDMDLFAGSLDGSAIEQSNSTSNRESIDQTLSAGTYFLVVYGYRNATNSYDLELRVESQDPGPTPPPATDYEPNDSTADAAEVALPFASDLEIGSDRDEDFFRVEANGTLTAQIDFSHAEGDLDLYLYSSTGRQLARSVSTTNQERISGDVDGGVYFIRVLGYRGATGSYSISIQ